MKQRIVTTNEPNLGNTKAISERRPKTMMELIESTRSTLATIMFIWNIIRQFYPYVLRRSLQKLTDKIVSFFNPYVRISIYEFVGKRVRSKAYTLIEAYLTNKFSDKIKRLKAVAGAGAGDLSFSMDKNERVIDEFQGIEIWWTSKKIEYVNESNSMYPDHRFYMLSFREKDRKTVTESYLKHVMNEGKEITLRRRERKLYTNNIYSDTLWSSVIFEHPATFDMLAIDPTKKREIVEDLLMFMRSKDYYARIGKAWKRGYLLYGPPGTGKSTIIAAIANLLNYDIYDVELTSVENNTLLKELFCDIKSKSIIVIEDIDCSLDLTNNRNPDNKSSKKEDEERESSSKVTLSGLLNAIDGIWSSCGGERIIVFTTNHVEKLDPALIRTGRMDKHIELSYCCFEAFKVLAKNYLDLKTHELFDQIHSLIKDVRITPADVAENLMPKSQQDSVENSLSRLIHTLEARKRIVKMKEAEEAKS